MLAEFVGVNIVAQPVDLLAVGFGGETDDDSFGSEDAFHGYWLWGGGVQAAINCSWRLGVPTKVRRSAESLFEVAAARLRFFGGVKLLHQLQRNPLCSWATLMLLGREVDVEERAKFPRLVAEDPAFRFEPRIKRRAGKSRQER